MQKFILPITTLCITILLSACSLPNYISSSKTFTTPSSNKSWRLSLQLKRKNIAAPEIALLPSLQPQFLYVTPPPIPELTLAYVDVPVVAPPFDPTELMRDSIVMFAQRYMNVRYVHGGKSAKGFDCSGFTSFVMAKFGYHISPASRTQAELGEKIPVEQAKKGDLAFFGYKNKKGKGYRVSHAALVMSEEGEELKIIHAARRGITIDDSKSSAWRKYYAPRFLYIKRIIKEQTEETTTNEVVALAVK